MSSDRMIEILGKTLERRRFLRNLGAGGLAAVLTTLGLSRPVQANGVHVACCHLCYSPGGDCSNTGCEWCWTCCLTATNTKYRCCEKFEIPEQTCDGSTLDNCVYVGCSTVTNLGGCPFGPEG